MPLTCPCCGQKASERHLTYLESILPFDGFPAINGQRHLASFIEVVAQQPNLYRWACDRCIEQGRAILARPPKQHYTFEYPSDAAAPFLAYYDRRFTCQVCGAKETFAKEEQQFWYEELAFIVYAKPTACRACRQDLRTQKDLNTELSELLKEGKPKQPEQLLRIAEIYQEMGKPEKIKEYLKAAKRAQPDP